MNYYETQAMTRFRQTDYPGSQWQTTRHGIHYRQSVVPPCPVLRPLDVCLGYEKYHECYAEATVVSWQILTTYDVLHMYRTSELWCRFYRTGANDVLRQEWTRITKIYLIWREYLLLVTLLTQLTRYMLLSSLVVGSIRMISLALREGRIPDKIVIYRMVRENTRTVPSISNVGPCPLTTGRQTDLITPFKPWPRFVTPRMSLTIMTCHNSSNR